MVFDDAGQAVNGHLPFGGAARQNPRREEAFAERHAERFAECHWAPEWHVSSQARARVSAPEAKLR